MWVLIVDTLERLLTVFCLIDGKSGINKPQPKTGMCGKVLMALTSNSSMNRFAMRGLIVEPIAAPQTCS